MRAGKEIGEGGACAVLENGTPLPHDVEVGIAEETAGLVGLLIQQAKRNETIINMIAEAVKKGDKDKVFDLAEELVEHG